MSVGFVTYSQFTRECDAKNRADSAVSGRQRQSQPRTQNNTVSSGELATESLVVVHFNNFLAHCFHNYMPQA